MTDIPPPPNFSQHQQSWLKWIPAWHLGLSLLIATALAILVTSFWFPAPYHLLAGGMQLFWWMLGVDVVCGPLLTWILIRPGKSLVANGVDLLLIACLQLGALAYGVHTLALARPLAIVFEVDRFRVISFSDIPEEEAKGTMAPAWLTPWQLHPPRVLGLRSVHGLSEKMASVELALQGIDAAQRPSRWQEYALNKQDILQRARRLEELRLRYPADASRIDSAANATTCLSNCVWLPLVGRRSAEWVVLIDPHSASLVGYLPLDGFF